MINLKQVNMVGFKSFADETNIVFDGNTTAIVGPNGCGKSNVSDAIRWVLGENSNKELRGQSMQDVIFAGTEKRKKMSYCEVSLVFDNSQKWFNVDFEEVVITRKLYRNGISEYYLNRQPVLKKDVMDMFHDCNLGVDGYAVIGQGSVSSIISSKPEARRVIFEEAVGISKFKKRKQDTENRLVKVRENLSRANDIMTEVERRLGPLKKQCEDAKKYLEYKEQLKSLEINAYIYQYDHASQTKQAITDKLEGLKDNLRVLTNAAETEQAKYEKALNEINQLDKNANELHDQVLQYTIKLEKKQGDTRLLTEQTKHLKEQLDRLESDIKAQKLDLGQRTALVESASEMKKQESERLGFLRAQAQRINDEYFALVDQITKSEGEKEENQRAIINNLSKLTDIKANLSAYTAKRDALNENIRQDGEKLNQLSASKQAFEAEFDQLQKSLQELTNKKKTMEQSIQKVQAKQAQIEQSLENINSNIFAIKSSISNDTNRMNILSNLQTDFEGYQFAVQRLMQEGKKNSELNSAIMGVVGNIIKVDEKFQTAIEIVLGGSIQNVVTKNEEDAKKLINFLKSRELGRATFLPISAAKPRRLSQSERAFLSMPGCLGVASEIVRSEPQFKPIIESLLGSTVVVDNLDNAIAVAKRSGYAFRIVTLIGDVLSPQGSMSGGSNRKKESSLLGKENEINKLKENISTRTKELHTIEEQQKSLVSALDKLKQMLKEELEKLQGVSNEFYSKTSRMEALQASISNADEDIFTLQSQIKVSSDVVAELNEKINSSNQAEQDYDNSKAKSNETEQANKTAYEELKQKRELYQEKMMSSRVEIASAEEKINSLAKNIEEQRAAIDGLNQTISRLERDMASQQALYNEAIQLNKNREEDSEMVEIQNTLASLNDKLAKFDEFKQSLMNEVKEIDEKKSNLNEEISRLNNRIFQEDARLQKVDLDIENMQERIMEEYEKTYNDCLPYKNQGPDFDIKTCLSEVSKYKNKITALGYVNINAIEEYKNEGSRYEEMSAQIADLKKAEEDSVSIIRDLSNEMLETFNREFAKIQDNFSKIFKDLFGGGNARLVLLPNEDPLKAGVEIIAHPPGKNLDNTSLLSGGEKTMTAIAILFAIVRLKPMPFCFLDEIEAALDDTNIMNFANYLKFLSNNTQFIIITHKKNTMEVADSLYGVTMEEKGVSKLVSVKLKDAVKVAEEEEKKEKSKAS